jgi:hypothetical protein
MIEKQCEKLEQHTERFLSRTFHHNLKIYCGVDGHVHQQLPSYRDETVLRLVYSDPRLLQYAIHTEAFHKHALLIGVMVTLLLGIIVAAQMERVHERTRRTITPLVQD